MIDARKTAIFTHISENHHVAIVSYHFISISDESDKSNITGKGPYSVTITLTSDSSEVSNCVTSGKQGLLPLHKRAGNYETPTGRNVLGETNRDCCGYQSITRGTNGFSLKRFLPREVTGESTDAYLLTRSSSRAIESGNTLGLNALGLRYVFFPLSTDLKIISQLHAVYRVVCN